ncbi:MAG: 23S rRNA (uracil(1939)-C(5))-methyltransferase RlmD [Tissierellia bacterium]|nr:23S rRNA (uracil(1939)-C(5))-methyltransferase RlmD [Tissierellia bacterium]
MARKNKIEDILVEEVHFPNLAQGKDPQGKPIEVKGGLPGQKIRVQVTRNRPEIKKAKFLEVLEPAPYEGPSPCPHSPVCGGCAYQTLSYQQESAYKKDLLDKLLAPYLGPQGIPYTPSPQEGAYRNKMEYTFGDEFKGGPLALGLHRKARFYELVNTPHCLLVHEDFNRLREAVRSYFEETGVPAYHRARHEGTLRHLVIRKSRATGQILLNLVTRTTDLDLNPLVDLLLALDLEGDLVSIYHTENDGVADIVQADALHLLYGQEAIQEELLGLKFSIGPFSFFQPNPFTAEIIYQKARDLAGQEKGLVFDLYSGTGTIGQILAQEAQKVIGIELVEEAVDQARKTAQLNGLKNVHFLAGDVLQVLDQVEEKPNLVVLDPPRTGVHPKAIQKILDLAPKRILYISCNPKTLAQDMEAFLASHYQLSHLEAIDQFPRTVHLECVALLSRK